MRRGQHQLILVVSLRVDAHDVKLFEGGDIAALVQVMDHAGHYGCACPRTTKNRTQMNLMISDN